MHSWLPVQTHTARYEKSTDNLCPLCQLVPETQDHIYCCQNPEAILHRVSAWHQCLESIRTKGKTCRYILDAFDTFGSPFLQLPQRTVPYIAVPLPGRLTPLYSTAVTDQTSIGWNYLFRGIAASSWGPLQALYMKDFEQPTTRWSLDSWQRVTVTALLDFGHALWRFRNDVKFGKDKISAARKRREQLETRVTLQYENKPYLLPKFTHLFLKPLPDRLRQGNRTLSAWLRHLEAYIKISEHAESSGGRQRDFRSYLPCPPGSTPSRYLDLAAERSLRNRRRRVCLLPKVIRKTRAPRKRKYPQPAHNPAYRISRFHSSRQSHTELPFKSEQIGLGSPPRAGIG